MQRSMLAILLSQPGGFAVHKLILAQKRGAHELAKSRKNLAQAASLIEALRISAPFMLEDTLEDAGSRGRDGWERPIARSLAQIGNMTV